MPENLMNERPNQPNKRKNEFATILIIVVVCAILFGAIGYVIGNKKTTTPEVPVEPTITDDQTSPVVDETATADVTANWKTYTNDQFGFSIKYPSDYTGNIASGYSENDGVTIDSPSTGGYEQPHLVNVEAQKSSQNFDDYIASAAKDSLFAEATKITFAGQPAYEGVESGMVTSYGIITEKNGNIFTIVLDTGLVDGLAKNKAAISDIENQILSTFQFTK